MSEAFDMHPFIFIQNAASESAIADGARSKVVL